MKRVVASAVIAGCAWGCVPQQAAAPGSVAASLQTSGVTPTSICQVVASLQGNPTAGAVLGSFAPTSDIGVVWADLQSGCAATVPSPAVSPSWTAEVAGLFKSLVATYAPTIVPLLVGLL